MFKIGKPIELNEQIEIFLSDGATYRFDNKLKKGVVEKEYKEINFVISGVLEEQSYSLSFMFNGPVEDLEKLEKHKNYDIRKYLHEGETFLGANGVFYEANIQGNILRFNNNKYIIEITFNTEDNDYCGYLEFDFLLDDYLNE